VQAVVGVLLVFGVKWVSNWPERSKPQGTRSECRWEVGVVLRSSLPVYLSTQVLYVLCRLCPCPLGKGLAVLAVHSRTQNAPLPFACAGARSGLGRAFFGSSRQSARNVLERAKKADRVCCRTGGSEGTCGIGLCVARSQSLTHSLSRLLASVWVELVLDVGLMKSAF
jgi:uncharacterized low-complexity protein